MPQREDHMFRHWFAWIVSDEGFRVRVPGRSGLEYREGKKRMRIDAEMLEGPAGLAIYPKSIRAWQPPFQDEAIHDAKQQRIVENIRRAFRFDGFDIEVR